MKHFIAILPFLLFTMLSHAELYKGIDADGNVIYSDEKLPNTKEIPMPTPNTIPMPKAVKKKLEEDKEEKPLYEAFTILSPGDNDTVRMASGDVQVTLSITPELNIEEGHRISVYVDGQASISTTQLNFQLPDINRGEHNLRAEVKDKNKQVLATSNIITFHMKRHSSQHKKPTGAAAPGPKKADGSSYKPGPQGTHFKPGPVPPPPAP